MSEINKKNVGTGAAYLYIEALSLMFSGYIYWLILSRIATPSEIGISSTTISIALIFMTIASFGISNGIQSYLGRSLLNKNSEEIRQVVNSSILMLSIGVIASGIFMISYSGWIYGSFKVDFVLSIISVLIMGFSTYAGLLRAIIIPSLKTRVITISSVLATIAKILVAVILVMLDWGVIGILIGYMMYPITSIFILAFAAKRILYNDLDLKSCKEYLKIGSIFQIRNILNSSLAFWIPNIVNIIGSQLGTITVFVSNGAADAGIYFMAFSIVTGISIILSVFSTIAYPTLSTMNDGRKRAVWRLIKISLLITIPISNILLYYTSEIMTLFGSSYSAGSSNLAILLLSILPTALITGVSVLSYSYNNNRHVLYLGLFTSFPRTLFYLILVPIWGGDGAAITYFAGSLIGCIASLLIAKKIGLKFNWRMIGTICFVPLLIALPFKLFDINYGISIVVSIIISYLILLRLKIIELEDIQDILRILPNLIVDPFVRLVKNVTSKTRRF